MWEAVRWEDMATFIGPNAARFEKTWLKLREGVRAKGYANALSFCWPALVFGFVWFLSRKQWVVGGLIIMLPILLGIVFSDLPGGAMTGISMVMAIYAKSLYLQTSVPKVAKIIERTAPGPDRDTQLRAAGGISRSGAIGGGMLLALLLSSAIYAIIYAH